MFDHWSEVHSLVVVFIISFGLGTLIFIASSYLAPSIFSLEKTLSYECGFEPFEDARSRFDVRFYLVALLFIIFDLEVAFLFPVVGQDLSSTGLTFCLTFLALLTLGFVYEWKQGALQWS
jgi:NADH-quinone oxidoreductase subunit A